MKPVYAALAVLVLSPFACLAALAGNNWLSHVPEKDRAIADPLTHTSDNVAAGQELFRRNCATCHGENAEGRRLKPSLRTPEVRSATDGELFWLLRNGSLAHGMPSWSRLPESERWQLIQYLRTLPE
jgi:mono/diheme cytochrome c family protein